MKHVFGPVPSRRLGRSLYLVPIPFKACTYNCVYCQLGRTAPVIRERRDFFPPEEIEAEVRAAFEAHDSGSIDHVIFVGEGEPLLCASMGRLIRFVKALTAIPVAVITNGSLLYRPEVRAELSAADVVMTTLDAADPFAFRRIHRAGPELGVGKIVAGLEAFREIFAGRLWVEVMLVRGVNDSEAVVLEIAAALRRVRPDQIHLNVPLRTPAEDWVEPPDEAGLARAMALLGEVAPLEPPAECVFEAAGAPVVDAIVEILRRHPMRHEEVVETVERWSPKRVGATLRALDESSLAQRFYFDSQFFWVYGDDRSASLARDASRAGLPAST